MGDRAARWLIPAESGSFQITAPLLITSVSFGQVTEVIYASVLSGNANMNGVTPEIFSENKMSK